VGTLTIPNTFSAAAVIVASEHNDNFTAIKNVINGDLDTSNLSATAAIVDTQLAQITTASKVSGTAVTGLASLPSGAGTVPSANLRKVVVLKVIADDEVLSMGDGKMYFTCPTELTGKNLVDADASVIVASTSGTPTIQIAKGRRDSATGALNFTDAGIGTSGDMLSTRITIDANEYDSANATAAPVIDTDHDDIVVSTYVDVLRVDVDVAGTGTKGLEVRLSFQTP
jgi:hypothetical protein